MGTISQKLEYLATTKTKIKDSINLTGAGITNEPFRQYAVKLKDAYVDIINNGTDTLYNNFPKVSGSGTDLSLQNTYEAPMQIDLKGNTSQTGTPTPSSPIPIKNVSGDNDIVVCGKNLFDKTDSITTGKTYSNTGGITTLSNSFIQESYVNVLSDAYYTMATITDYSSETDFRFIINEYDENKTFIKRNLGGYSAGVRTSYSVKLGATTKYVRLCASTITIDELMFVKGNIAPTTYEVYNGTTYNIDLPVENLLNEELAKNVSNYTESIGSSYYGMPIQLLPNTTYTISTFVDSPVSADNSFILVVRRYETPTQNLFIINSESSKPTITNESYTFATGESGILYLVERYGTTEKITSILNQVKLQIEKGSKPNTYTPYGTTPIELNKIGTYQDYFYKQDDKWYLHKEIGKVVLDGSESGWVSETAYTGYYRFNITGILPILTRGNNGFNNRFTQRVNQPHGDYQYLYLQQNNGYIHIQILQSLLTNGDVNTFKTWLASNNVSVYYILATPTYTEITDTTLKGQLEDIYNAKSKNGETNISQINSDLPFIITSSALKKD